MLFYKMNSKTSLVILAAFAMLDSYAFAATLIPAKPELKIDGKYIIVLKDQKNDAFNIQTANVLQSMVDSMEDSKVIDSFPSLNGFSAQLSDDALKQVLNNPQVKYVEEDSVMYLNDDEDGDENGGDSSAEPSVTWGLDRIDQRALPLDQKYVSTVSGSGVNAYVIDTGIFPNSDFGNRVQEGYNAMDDGKKGQDDCNSHGTHVAGTIGSKTYGVAKNVTLYPVRVFSCSGTTSTATVIKGVEWVTQNAKLPAVANMSLGGSVVKSMEDAIKASIKKGISYGVAAGNSSEDACSSSPARLGKDSDVVSVGATSLASSKDKKATFSNYGECVSLFAPGDKIVSTLNKSQGNKTLSGTSMASPHAVGAIALYLEENPSATPKDVKAHLVSVATPDVIESVGDKSVNKLLYVGQ